MAFLGQLPACVSALHTDLCDNIGGSFHSSNQELDLEIERSPESKLSSDARQLSYWVKRRSRQSDQADSLDKLFEAAIRDWVKEKNKELDDNKKSSAEFMALEAQYPITTPAARFQIHNLIDERNQPPVFEDVDEFVCIEDGANRQIAVLNKWNEQPSSVFEAVPRIKAAFDCLKKT